MAPRNRLTDQAIANIGAAKSAQLTKAPGGWNVTLSSKKATVVLADKNGRPVLYKSKGAATRAIGRHNASLEPSIAPQL
jgi:hypothetical protein